MLLAVVVLFTVSWLPYHAYFIFLFHHPSAAYEDYIQHVYLAMYLLAMAHTMYNPIVYYCMNKRLVCLARKISFNAKDARGFLCSAVNRAEKKRKVSCAP